MIVRRLPGEDCGCIVAKLLFRPDGMIAPPVEAPAEVGTKMTTTMETTPAFPRESVGVKGAVVVKAMLPEVEVIVRMFPGVDCGCREAKLLFKPDGMTTPPLVGALAGPFAGDEAGVAGLKTMTAEPEYRPVAPLN